MVVSYQKTTVNTFTLIDNLSAIIMAVKHEEGTTIINSIMDLLKNADGNELEIDGKKLIFTINLIQDEFIQMQKGMPHKVFLREKND